MSTKLRDQLIGAWKLVSYERKTSGWFRSVVSHERKATRNHYVHA